MDEQRKAAPDNAGVEARGDYGPAEGYLRAYGESHNPLHLWGALRSCRANGLPLPEEVLAHLERVARSLLRLAESSPTPPSRVGPALQRALGFRVGKGSGSEFSDYRKWLNDRALAIDIDVARHGQRGVGKEKAAERIAAAHGVSVSTVKRALKLHGDSGTAAPDKPRPKRSM